MSMNQFNFKHGIGSHTLIIHDGYPILGGYIDKLYSRVNILQKNTRMKFESLDPRLYIKGCGFILS